MNIEARRLLLQGERELERHRPASARACFVEAGESAVAVQLWRCALYCFRQALELDLLDREIVGRVLELPHRVIARHGWEAYAQLLEGDEEWLAFGCREAHVVAGTRTAFVECGRVGPVIDLTMRDGDLVDARPIRRFARMPVAMGMIIMRRALWPAPSREREPMKMAVAFAGRPPVGLDEHGDWDPVE